LLAVNSLRRGQEVCLAALNRAVRSVYDPCPSTREKPTGSAHLRGFGACVDPSTRRSRPSSMEVTPRRPLRSDRGTP
jgi:hypothetical protein